MRPGAGASCRRSPAPASWSPFLRARPMPRSCESSASLTTLCSLAGKRLVESALPCGYGRLPTCYNHPLPMMCPPPGPQGAEDTPALSTVMTPDPPVVAARTVLHLAVSYTHL